MRGIPPGGDEEDVVSRVRERLIGALLIVAGLTLIILG